MNSNLILLPNALSFITYSVSLTIKHSICCIHYIQGEIFWPEVATLAPRRLRQKNPYKSETSMGFRVRLSQNKPLKNKKKSGHNTVPHNPLQVETGGSWELPDLHTAPWHIPMHACTLTHMNIHIHTH